MNTPNQLAYTALRAKIREVLKHHKLTEHGDGVVEADLAAAMLAAAPSAPAEPVAWRWRLKSSERVGFYTEPPKKFGLDTHPDYEWTPLYAVAQEAAPKEQG